MSTQDQPSWTCPHCGMTSFNPNDVRYGYCGACHHFCADVDRDPPPELARGLVVCDFDRHPHPRDEDDRPCRNPRPVTTKSGRVLTDADIEALADEAEAGYDVSHLVAAPSRRSGGIDQKALYDALWDIVWHTGQVVQLMYLGGRDPRPVVRVGRHTYELSSEGGPERLLDWARRLRDRKANEPLERG